MSTSVSGQIFEFVLCLVKNVTCVQSDGSNFWKIAHLQYKISEALRWRAARPGDLERTLVCQQVYRDRFLSSELIFENGSSKKCTEIKKSQKPFKSHQISIENAQIHEKSIKNRSWGSLGAPKSTPEGSKVDPGGPGGSQTRPERCF